MNIGTGKVSKKEQRMVKHHLLDVANPKKIFTVSDFKKLGRKALNDILNRSKLPIIVGGTGFYIDALIRNFDVPEVPPNKKLRARFDKLTVERLFKMLQKVDPRRAKNIDSRNKRRLIRALEITMTTKKSSLNTKYKIQDTKYKILWLGINPGGEKLKKKIKKRLDARLKQGMVKEVKNLLKSGVSKKRLHDLGLEYRWISRYLNREVDYKNMREGLLGDIIKYSKRQMTWFKRNKEIHWLAPSKVKGVREAEKLTRVFVRSHREA